MALQPNIKIAQIQSIIGKMDAEVYNTKYNTDPDLYYYKKAGIVSILLTNNTIDAIHVIAEKIDRESMLIVYGAPIDKHDSYIFDGRVIASVFFKGDIEIYEQDCTLCTGIAVDGTVIFQILYKYCSANYCVKLPQDVTLEKVSEYGINFTKGKRLIFIQTFAGQAYYADCYRINEAGYINFIKIP